MFLGSSNYRKCDWCAHDNQYVMGLHCSCSHQGILYILTKSYWVLNPLIVTIWTLKFWSLSNIILKYTVLGLSYRRYQLLLPLPPFKSSARSFQGNQSPILLDSVFTQSRKTSTNLWYVLWSSRLHIYTGIIDPTVNDKGFVIIMAWLNLMFSR